jgi:hypothetical protein
MSDDAVLSPEQELQAREMLAKRTGAIEAVGHGARLAGQTAAVGIIVSVVYAVVSTAGLQLVGSAFAWITSQPDEALQSTAQLFLGLGGLLSLYAFIQFLKRHTATRESWFPALFALPTLITAGALMMAGSEAGRQLGPAMFQMLLIPFLLVLYSIGGAACAIAWVRSGDQASKGEAVDTGAVLAETRSRLVEISGPHGARQHAVSIGMQILVPGIFYALQLAFVDMVAVLDPERPALKRSGDLTWGMRGRLFRVFAIWALVTYGIVAALQIGLDGTEAVTLSLVDPRELSLHTYFLSELVTALTSWVLTLSLLVLYQEREAQVAAKRAIVRHEKAAAAASA